MAALFPKPVLSNVWLPLKLLQEDETAYKSLCLWWNSSLHILMMLAYRVETQGAWVAFLRRAIAKCPILNVDALSGEAVEQNGASVRRAERAAVVAVAADGARILCGQRLTRRSRSALGLPDLTPLREQLAREPVISLQPLRQKRQALS
jgi:hypothetical protein